ncbi:MAG: sulfatase-like hydrolase/transferase [Acidobacteria bacterium]|nr:sulfatase-like hydrolase/transferase [Acidobacteriota bacterium]
MNEHFENEREPRMGSTGAVAKAFPLRIPLALGAISLAMDALLRVVLVFAFGSRVDVPTLELGSILVRGLLNDLVVLPAMLLPVATALFILPPRVRASLPGRFVVVLLVAASVFGRLYLSFIEYYFFDEFSSRLNLVAVDYLMSPTEVMVNIWESYPVGRVLALTGVATAVALFVLRGALTTDLEAPASGARRFSFLAIHVTLAVALPALVPLDILAMHEPRADQMSYNGVASFVEALRTNDLSYSDYYRMLPERRAFAIVRNDLLEPGVQWSGRAASDLRRDHAASRSSLAGRNVVVILEESLGCEHAGVCGGKGGLTPNLDRIAANGIVWTSAWATGTRTVRGLEAVITSLPPIPSRSIVKRPGSENIANWGQVMQLAGYHTSFLYGGYGTFDNMNHFFASNGFAVSDRAEIENAKFSNIWGVSDEDLFAHAVDYFDARAAERRPFFSLILTTSNHKPFTFREGVPGVPAEGGGRKAGVRYADFALGEFMREASHHSWYGNTVFVVLGDHGSRVYGHGEIPLPSYRIPVVIFGSGVEPGVLSVPSSQIDVAPTMLGLLGIPYSAPFYGRDVLAHPDPDRPIFVSHNHDVGMLVGDRLAVLGLQRSSAVFRYDRRADSQFLLAPDSALIDRATAAYESAFLVFSRRQYR